MKKVIVLCSILGAVASLYAQDTTDKGTLTGSLETNNIYYVKDNKLDASSAASPDDHFGSNNYLKVDYSKGHFSAGIQLEGYLPALQGYDYANTATANGHCWEPNISVGKMITSAFRQEIYSISMAAD